MTPADIETAARRKYNSVNSSFYSSEEIYDLIYQAELEIARETKMLEGLTTISGGTVAGTKAYAYPSGVLELRRVEVDGQRLNKIDLLDDDAVTLLDSNTTNQGTPTYYYEWDNTINLRPIPDTSSLQIRVYYFKDPARVTSASQTLEVPALFHMCIVDYVTAEIAQKDQNGSVAQTYFDKWYNKHLPAMMAWVRKKKTGDKFNMVKDVAQLADPLLW